MAALLLKISDWFLAIIPPKIALSTPLLPLFGGNYEDSGGHPHARQGGFTLRLRPMQVSIVTGR